MAFWFVVHDLKAYEQHSDLIGCRLKKDGSRRPRFSRFADIKKGDKIVYYASGNSVIVGIFNVISGIKHVSRDRYWKEIMAYRIEPADMPQEGFYVDLKKAITTDKGPKFDLFQKRRRWYSQLQGRTCVKLTEHDYLVMKDLLKNREYLVAKNSLFVPETFWQKHTARRGEEE